MARSLLKIIEDVAKQPGWSQDAVDGKIAGLSNKELIEAIDMALTMQQQEKMIDLLATRRKK